MKDEGGRIEARSERREERPAKTFEVFFNLEGLFRAKS